MNQRSLTLSLALGVLIAFLVSSSIFVLSEGQQALVLEFGRYVRTIKSPGLHAKLPFVQNVVVMDARLLGLNLPPEEVIASDQKRLVVDIFLRYRIIEPLKFYQAVRTEALANSRLQAYLVASLSRIMGRFPMATVLSPRRVEMMALIEKEMNIEAKDLGIEVQDVRIVRTDLPQENSEAIYKRMNSERQREAQEIRSTGNEMSRKIEAEADKEKTVIVSEAQRKAQSLKGEGERVAGQVYAKLQQKDPTLYLFLRSLEAYKSTFSDEDTTYVMVPDSSQDFFKYYQKP